MSEDLSAFERQLGAVRLRDPGATSSELAELFYQCGYQAATSQRNQLRRSNRAWAFVSGALSASALCVLVLLGWSFFPGPEPFRTVTNQVELPVPQRTALEEPPEPGETLARVPQDENDAAMSAGADNHAFFKLMLALRQPWQPAGQRQLLPRDLGPLSPMANRRWLPLIEGQPFAGQVPGTETTGVTGSRLPIRAQPLSEDLLDELL